MKVNKKIDKLKGTITRENKENNTIYKLFRLFFKKEESKCLLENVKKDINSGEHINLMDFVLNLEKANNLKDFANIQEKVESIVNKSLEPYLNQYSDSVKEVVIKRSLMGFNGTLKEREQALYIIFQKNKLYYSMILLYIQNGGLDNILSKEDKQDIISIMKSKYLEVFDEIFISWLLEGQDMVDKIPQGLYYGGIKEHGGLNTYFSFKSVRADTLGELNNDILQQYIRGIRDLSYNSYKAKDWEKNIEKEPLIWKNKKSKLGFVGPQEAYHLVNEKNGGKLVEPHIALYMKEEFEIEKKQAIKLYNKYFGKSYGVNNLSSYFVEPLFESGAVGFAKIAGESIPNPQSVSEKFGKINLIIPSRNKSRMKEQKSKLEFLLGNKLTSEDFENTVKESEKFVKFHEIGHSLFKENNYRNSLEELKADLSYFLKLYDELESNKKIDIESVLNQFIMDSLRVLKNVNYKTGKINGNMKQYVISTAVELKKAFDSGLLVFEDDKLKINKGKFDKFIEQVSKLIFEIRNIYEKQSGELEKKFLHKNYDIKDKNIQKFIELANK